MIFSAYVHVELACVSAAGCLIAAGCCHLLLRAEIKKHQFKTNDESALKAENVPSAGPTSLFK